VGALQQALSDWQGGTGPACVVLALLDLVAEEVTAQASVLKPAREALRTVQDRRHAALEAALGARIRALNHRSSQAPFGACCGCS